MATLTGTMLGKYQVLERIGRGGMADVYRGHHTRLDRDVAIKVVHPHLIEGQGFLARFEREAKAVASLKHSHIVQVFDFDSQDDLHYLIMELINGGSLRSRLEDLTQTGSRLPLEDTLRIFGHIASAIDYAHRHGMLHRDVKPANVLLDKGGDAYLSDFGIARILSQTQFTTTGALIGTPQYMSPEQGKGLPLTESADLYSLGVVLYEMLTGGPPYDGDTPLGVIHKHLFDPLPSPRAACPDLPARVDDLMLKALAKEPGDRYSSGAEMLQALEGALVPGPAVPSTRPASQKPEPKKKMPRHVPSETLRVDQPTPPVPEERVVSSLPAGGMEAGRSEAYPEAARTRRAPRWGGILLGVAAVAVVAVALALVLPRVLGGGLIVPATPGTNPTTESTRVAGATSTTAGSDECITLADCVAQAETARQAGRVADAIEAYTRAQALVPQEEYPAYAFLWCDMASANLMREQPEAALVNFQRCIDWTGDTPAGRELRLHSQEAILAISGGAFANRVADYNLGANALAECTDPASALGPPDFEPDRVSNLFCLGVDGQVVLEFVYNLAIDGPGPDIAIHGDPGMEDRWHVDVSADGTNWAPFGLQPEVAALDLATVGMTRVRFIRLTDAGIGNGAELDAIEALHSEPAG